MKDAYIIDAIRTPFGRYAGGLAPVRADNLGAVPIQALMQRNPSVDWTQVDDVIYGCANQAAAPTKQVKTTVMSVVCLHCLQVYPLKFLPRQ